MIITLHVTAERRFKTFKTVHVTEPKQNQLYMYFKLRDKLTYLAAMCSGVRLSSLDRTSIRAP